MKFYFKNEANVLIHSSLLAFKQSKIHIHYHIFGLPSRRSTCAELPGDVWARAEVDVGKGDLYCNKLVAIVCPPRRKAYRCLLTCIFIDRMHALIMIRIDRKKTTSRKQPWLCSSIIGHYVPVETQNSFEFFNSKG